MTGQCEERGETMISTKDQERQAVNKIRKIVEGLGTDSYVAAAMAGVLELAEQNIEQDFACSLLDRAERAEKDAEELRGIIHRLRVDIKQTRDENAWLAKTAKQCVVPVRMRHRVRKLAESLLTETTREILETADDTANANDANAHAEAAKHYWELRSRYDDLTAIRDYMAGYGKSIKEVQ